MAQYLDENVCATSLHTKMQMRDGQLVELYSFSESFDKHVTFAVETYRDYAPPTRNRRPGCRMHSANLDPRYTPPHSGITERLIVIIDELMTEELVQLITQQRIEVRRRSEAERDGCLFVVRSNCVASDRASYPAFCMSSLCTRRRSSSSVVVVACVRI